MRRLIALPTFLLLFNTACTAPHETGLQEQVATMLHYDDPRAGRQLTKGVWPPDSSGRWTGRTFTAVLKPPPAAMRKGAVLILRFGIPQSLLDQLHVIRLSAKVNGVALDPEEYRTAGEWTYIRELSPAAFRAGDATVDFTLDKALSPTATERRELGVVLTAVGFEAR